MFEAEAEDDHIVGAPMRTRLLSLITCWPVDETFACDTRVHFGMSDPAISHHPKGPRTLGLIDSQWRGGAATRPDRTT
jgi:ArsR family transcriptional regulator